MKKETNPKAKRNGLWCNVLIVAALLLIVAVLMVVLRRNAPANVDAARSSETTNTAIVSGIAASPPVCG